MSLISMGLAFLCQPALLVVDRMLHDLSGDLRAADHRRERRANGLREIRRHLREAERRAVEVRRYDSLRDEADFRAGDGERRAARIVAARLERDAGQPECRPVAVALETHAAAYVLLVEGDGPAESALVGRHGGVVLDAADDEAAFDAEQIEGGHPDHPHP